MSYTQTLVAAIAVALAVIVVVRTMHDMKWSTSVTCALFGLGVLEVFWIVSLQTPPFSGKALTHVVVGLLALAILAAAIERFTQMRAENWRRPINNFHKYI